MASSAPFIANSLLDLIGNTPLVRLAKYQKKLGLKANVLAKLEYFNPAGSVKDRAAIFMIEEAEKQGLLKPGATIIEPTSGNTGVGLALVAAIKGYKLILTMPETMSMERRKLLMARGAELVLTSGKDGIAGAVKMAEELNARIENSIILQQFDNESNPLAHEKTTSAEILRDTEGKIDYFIAGVGTGGTISGVGKALKAHNPHIKIIAVEPSASPLLSDGKAGPHKIQGIGANFVPKNYKAEYVDEIITISNEDAMSTAKEAASFEGILVGISSGAALKAAFEVASREEAKDKNIVVLLADTGERYLSTELFKDPEEE